MERIYGDIIWGALILVWILILKSIPQQADNREFIGFTSQHCLYWGICKVLHFSFHGRYAWFSNQKRSLEIPTRIYFQSNYLGYSLE